MFILDYFQNSTAFLFGIGILSLMIGSFLNVVIVRLPHHSLPNPSHPIPSLWEPRSRCLNCLNVIHMLDNIPLLSFCYLKGRCRHCQHPISFRYPLVELLTCFFSVLVAAHFGIHIITFAALMFTWSLVTLAFIDYEHLILPNSITLPFMVLGLLLNSCHLFCSFQDAVVGAIIGYYSLWTVYQVHKLITHKEGMGYGDFKLLAMMGAWLGWQYLPLIILISSLLGSIIGMGLILFQKKDKDFPFPFGPYLALAGVIVLLRGKHLFQFMEVTL
jgi:leader peptidase (prepilin peptidase)/N-methyltransferase